MKQMIEPFDIRHRSGFEIAVCSGLSVLKKDHYRVVDVSIPGDAPKQMLRVYEYGHGHRARPSSWPQFIAKGGQKAYPNESITEHFVTRIGQALGMHIADSRLMWIGGQIRFLSRYFLKEGQSLIHGAEVFSGYLAQDATFVQEVEEKGFSSQIFTFQVAQASLKTEYPSSWMEIMLGLVRLLAFDAIVGNNDRHYINWGVVKLVTGKGPVSFAPVYDTARALLWNIFESNLRLWETDNIERRLDGYIRRSRPKMGWDGASGLSHFDLVRRIALSDATYQETLHAMIPAANLPAMRQLLEGEFARLFSPIRARIVLRCLEKRIDLFVKCLENT
jgi:hypothetical protein